MSSASDPPSAIRRRIHNQTLSLEGRHAYRVAGVGKESAGGQGVRSRHHVQPEWATAEGRKKPQNLQRDPRIIISVQNRTEPQSYLLLNGTATVTETGADAHADKLAKRFLGVDKYPYRQPGEKRLIVRVKVDRLGGIDPKMRPWT